MRHRHLAAALTAALLILGAAAQAAPVLGGVPSLAAPDRLLLVGNGDGGFRDDLNRARDRKGRDPVRHDRRLEGAAQDYADQMARSGRLSHTGPDGSDPQQRAQDADCSCVAVAENIARGPGSVGQVFDAWMDSKGHRRNMLGRDYASYGLGRSGDVWVLMLSD